MIERQVLVTIRDDGANPDLTSALSQTEKPGEQRRGLRWVLKVGTSSSGGTLEIQMLTDNESRRLREVLSRTYRPQ